MVERRRLAGAVGAEQADDLAQLDRDPDVVDHAVPVGPHQALGHQGRATVRPGLEPAHREPRSWKRSPPPGFDCTWARTSRLIVKCSRLGSLSADAGDDVAVPLQPDALVGDDLALPVEEAQRLGLDPHALVVVTTT